MHFSVEPSGKQRVASTTISNERKPDLFYPGLIDGSNAPSTCPKCRETNQNEEARRPRILAKALRGPYVRYEMRETELVFDLKKKYLECPSCGSEITILDFQVLVGDISATLPPVKARRFTMKMLGLYRDSHEYAIEVLSILRGDFSEGKRQNDYLEELEQLIQPPVLRSGK
jgi:hypothetical protein